MAFALNVQLSDVSYYIQNYQRPFPLEQSIDPAIKNRNFVTPNQLI